MKGTTTDQLRERMSSIHANVGRIAIRAMCFNAIFAGKRTGTCEMKTYGILPFFHLHGICMYLHCLYVQKRSQITRRHEDSYDSFAP